MTRNGIEARKGQDGETRLGRNDESPVGGADAPETGQVTNHTNLIERLKPCPLCCGCDVYADSIYSGEERVFCAVCDTQGPCRADRAEAIKAWNTRTNDPTLIAEVEGLREALREIEALCHSSTRQRLLRIATAALTKGEGDKP